MMMFKAYIPLLTIIIVYHMANINAMKNKTKKADKLLTIYID